MVIHYMIMVVFLFLTLIYAKSMNGIQSLKKILYKTCDFWVGSFFRTIFFMLNICLLIDNLLSLITKDLFNKKNKDF